MSIAARRQSEAARYEQVYHDPSYGLGKRRRDHIHYHLKRVHPKGSLLDVSTGRGEVLHMACVLGFTPVKGTEAVEYLCDGETTQHALAHNLPFPDASFDTVTMFDVMEHLLPEDTEAVCRELARVARSNILLTVHNGPSSWRNSGGDLHINRRVSYEAWHEELCEVFAPWRVIRHGAQESISEMFEVAP